MKKNTGQSDLSKQLLVSLADVKEGIYSIIVLENTSLTRDSKISLEMLNRYRKKYLTMLISEGKGVMNQANKTVADAINNNAILSDNILNNAHEPTTLGERLADKIATFGGSWAFIIFFFSFIVCWMIINIWLLANKPFDPFPFILLNLILSCLAAIQAPIIMMSQNRQEQKDRQRSEQDYKINLKAELEIQLLNEKIDHLLIHQNQKLLEIQELQTDYLNDLLTQVQKK
jgi:uncharacterized membrane protein